MTARANRPLLLAAGVAIALTATACGGSNDAAEPAEGQVSVVTSTNVWGSVARAVGGDKVFVKSIIDDPSADPHSYESSPADSAAVNDARLVVYNGGGYDDFFTGLAEQAPDAQRIVAFDESGKAAGERQGEHGEGHAQHEDHGQHQEHGEHQGEQHGEGHAQHEGHEGHEHGAVNEHVWYDLPTVQKVANQIATRLSAIQPESKNLFQRNAKKFTGQLDDLIARTERIPAGKNVLATEPVSHYLIDAAGLRDVTPEEYVDAVENEGDVPPATIAEVNKLIAAKKVTAVLENTQTETPTTTDIVRQAKDAGIPIVPVTETLPEGTTSYVDWMSKQVNALSQALTPR